jgi:catechol 2,3-dioxygenase
LMEETPEVLVLGAGGVALVELELGAARPVAPKTLGLYHVAIHVPARADLAQMAVRALQRQVRISPTDHLVSEAIYLWDLDGNGIEITFETPWRGSYGDPDAGYYAKTADGQPHSGREPIDMDDLLGALGPAPQLQALMPPGTRIGHVHVHVRDLQAAMRFYRDGLGFGGLFIIEQFGMGDVMLNTMPHIVAFNIWSGPNAVQPPEGVAGLRWFNIILPDVETLNAVRARLQGLGSALEDVDGVLQVRDPSGNRVRLILA